MTNILAALDLGERLGKLEGRSVTTVRFVSGIMGILTTLFLGVGGYLYTTSQSSIENLKTTATTLQEQVVDAKHANETLNEKLNMVILLLIGDVDTIAKLRTQ